MTQNTNTIKTQNGIDPKFIKQIDGKDFVLYNGLLDYAHQRGLKKLTVDILQYPNSENGNTCICRATAVDSEDREFSEISDASPESVDSKMVQCFIRCAATRSKSRCLRDLTNTPMVCFEELGADTTVVPNGAGEPKYSSSKTEKAEPKPSTPSSSNSSTTQNPIPLPQQNSQSVDHNKSSETVSKISPAQRNAIENLAQRSKLSTDELNRLSVNTYGNPVEELTSLNAANMIRILQKSA